MGPSLPSSARNPRAQLPSVSLCQIPWRLAPLLRRLISAQTGVSSWDCLTPRSPPPTGKPREPQTPAARCQELGRSQAHQPPAGPESLTPRRRLREPLISSGHPGEGSRFLRNLGGGSGRKCTELPAPRGAPGPSEAPAPHPSRP